MKDLIIILIICIGLVILCSCRKKVENYRDPIYLSEQNLMANELHTTGTIYGPSSNIFTGWPFYDKAY